MPFLILQACNAISVHLDYYANSMAAYFHLQMLLIAIT
jgi:hypothetical protein